MERVSGMRQRARGEEGSSLLEFAMTFTILAAILFGIFEFGLLLYDYNFVCEAARDATRYASVRGTACTGFSDCDMTSAQLVTYVQGLTYGGINLNNLTVTPSWVCSSTANPPCNSPGNFVAVTISYQFPLEVPFIPQKTYTLASTSQMAISQ
jgi:Flp pilus assembly protein TadG